MANYVATATWQDADADTTVQTFELVAADEAAALTALQNMIEAQDTLNEVLLIDLRLNQIVDFSGYVLKAVPVANSDVEIGGRFQFRTATVPRYYKEVTVPGFRKNTYVQNKNIILTNADVLAFTGVINGQGFTTNHYEDLVATVKGYEVFNGKP